MHVVVTQFLSSLAFSNLCSPRAQIVLNCEQNLANYFQFYSSSNATTWLSHRLASLSLSKRAPGEMLPNFFVEYYIVVWVLYAQFLIT
jgi:hypothetical protein